MGRSSSYHTNTTGGHICGYHDGTLASFELVQDPVTFVLLFVAMDSCRESKVSKDTQYGERESTGKTYTALAIRPDGGIG
jgi:hypothetical protein